MKPAALIYLLWTRNPRILAHYLAHRPGRKVFTYAALITDAMRETVAARGGELLPVDAAATPELRERVAGLADQKVAACTAFLASDAWRVLCGEHGFEPEKLARVMEPRLAPMLKEELSWLACLESIRASHEVELLVLNEDWREICKSSVLWARAHAIPSLHFSHGLGVAGNYTVHDGLHADSLAVYGPRGLEPYLDLGVDPGRMAVVGNPSWDIYVNSEERRRQVNREGSPIVVFFTTWDARLTAQSNGRAYEDSLRDFFAACSRLAAEGRRIQAVVKDRPSNAAFGEAAVARLAREAGLQADGYLYATTDTELWVQAADVVVSVDSNLSIEASLAGTPAINLTYDQGLRLGPSFEGDSGIVEARPSALAPAITALLEDGALRTDLLARMQAACPRYNAVAPEQAAQRLAELMLEKALPVAGAVARPVGGYVWEQLSNQEGADLKGAYHDHPRVELLRLLERGPRRVLDVGCATGATGELIKTAWPEAHVTGIELNRAAAEQARSRIDLVLDRKLEDIDFAAHGIAPGSIDCVILADVLEHLYDPWDALLRIKPLLTEDAQVLVSLPNARNLWLLNELAGGHFPYAAEGLLDITHIRWFTRAEMEKMLRETGYVVRKSGRTPTAGLQDLTRPAGSTTVETEKIILKDVGDEEFEDLKALQILFLARPMKPGEAEQAGGQDLYELWQLGHSYLKRDAQWISERLATLTRQPVFHLAVIVPEGGEERLVNNLKSLGHQFHPHWRLTVISGEPAHASVAEAERMSWVQTTPERQLAEVNRALREQEADWVGVWQAGDKLAPHALFAFTDQAERHPDWQVIYSDEDQVDAQDEHSTPFFKTDFNLEMLRAAPYAVGGLLLLRRELFLRLQGFDPELEGVEALDLTLRAAEAVGRGGVGHIADILYHRHAEGGHCRIDADARAERHRRAVAAHLSRLGLDAAVEEGTLPGTLRVRYAVAGNPLVSILIPTKNQVEMLKRCITSLVEITGWSNCEILVLDNGGDEADARAYLDELRALNSPRLKVLDCAGPFNFSAINNRGAREATGDYLVLLNNDTAVLHAEWLEEMLGLAQQPDVGAVGAKLFYPDGKVQHAGVVLGMNNSPADHPFIGQEADDPGYFGRALLSQEYSAVTAACMLVKRSLYLEIGGLDETRFQVSYNDVDFCVRLRKQGYRNVFTPHARLLHEGSVSQTSDVESAANAAKMARFKAEQEHFYDAWRTEVAYDPAYNRNLSSHGRDFLIEIAPALSWAPDWRPRPRVLAHPADRFGCGEYRIIAPMRAMNDAGRVMGWETGNYLTPPELFRLEPDVILLQRQVDPHQLELIDRYIRHSKALRVYEIDDLITNVPVRSIRKKHFVEQKDLHKRFRKGLSLCDRFIVSTEYLAEQYKGYNPDIRVVKNYIERARWGELKPSRRHGAKARVGWAGSVTHDGDLAVIFDVVKATAKEVDWVFFGMCPEEIRPYVAENHPGVGLEQYPAKLASLDLDLAVAPLEDVPFNHGKSHLRLLEYGVLGYPVICTDITPYRGDYPVTRVQSRFKDWVDAIRSHVADRDELARRGDALKDYIDRNWILEDNLDVWAAAWLP